MERRVFFILVLSAGLCHASSAAPQRKYQLISRRTPWHQAHRFCRDKHSDLASVRDERDLEDLAALMGSKVTEVFIGLHRGWGWTRSDADDYKEGEPVYENWAENHPVNHECGGLGPGGTWFAAACSRALKFFCYNGSTTRVSERFIRGDVSLNWAAARAHCRNRHTDLARVRNAQENQELQKLQSSVSSTQFWTGLTRSFWKWTDRNEATFTPWRPNRAWTSGSSRCSVLQVHGDSVGVANIKCNSERSFVCYKDVPAPLRKVVVRLTLAADGSSLNMLDPVVRGSILKQVEKMLRDQGSSEYLRVSWTKAPEKNQNRDQEAGCGL